MNRDLSWLAFNRRVLHEALDERTPLLERVRFLAIFNSNLDEFYMKRVGALKRQMAAGVVGRTADGYAPRELLEAIRAQALEMFQAQATCFEQSIRPALARHGVHLLNWSDLSESERAWAKRYFDHNLFPVLTPLAVDPGHPFPFISNLSLSLGVMLRTSSADSESGEQHHESPAAAADGTPLQFARVKIPSMFPRWVRIGEPNDPPPYRFITLEQIIRQNLQSLFQGMVIEEVEPFRITRNADVERDEVEADDLLELIEQELRDRRFAQVIRLEMDSHPHPVTKKFLMEQLEVDEIDVYSMPAELDYIGLHKIADLPLPELKYEPWSPLTPPRLADEEADIFSLIRQGDILVHHPYESFKTSVERFIHTAASDPKVVAIKLTLYRTTPDSPFILDLIRAAETGKQVVALVEIKARFDEELNIRVAQQLEKAGVHVVYGIVGLKTHTKTAIVVRQETDGMRVYAHIGTGNYNPKTAQVYTDLGLFTCRSELTSDLVDLFHYLTGRSLKYDFQALLIAPTNMRRRFVEMIDREIAHAAPGNTPKTGPTLAATGGRGLENAGPSRGIKGSSQPANEGTISRSGSVAPALEGSLEIATPKSHIEHSSAPAPGSSPGSADTDSMRPRIIAKMNSLEDTAICKKLYEASQAGVRVELYVRGFCCLRPGVPGLSENITVTSVVGRFLEHSRIFYFHNAGHGEYYIGSADWMYRNLYYRVECVTPIVDAAAQAKLREILDTMRGDQRQAWDMQPDGSYVQRQPGTNDAAGVLGTHRRLMDLTRRECQRVE